MIFGIIKDGVRGAFVRIVRTIVYIIIGLVIFYVIGLVTSKKASALVIKNQVYMPAPTNNPQVYTFSMANGTNHWYDFNFQSQWTNTSDSDLVGFRFKRQTEIGYTTTHGTSTTNNNEFNLTDRSVNYTGVLWDSNGNAQLCYTSADIDNVFLCPIQKNVSYTGISIVVNTGALNTNNYQIWVSLEFEQNCNFYNYDSTDIINYMQQNGNVQIVQQQEITNQIITQQQQYISDNTTTQSETDASTGLSTVATEFNDLLNGWGGQWSSLTHIVLEPINVILQSLSSSSTCQPIVLNVPYMQNKQVILPCMSGIYNQYFGTLIALFITIFSGLFAYRTIMKIIQTIKEVLDAENDKIEVIDL